MSWAVGGDPVKGFIQGFSIGALNHCGDHPTDGYRKITIQRPDAIQSTRSVNLEPIPVPVSGVSVSESGGVSAIDGFQMFLDGAGVVDPTPICDGINALIYLGRGQFGYAGISALGILPYVGDLGKAGKYGAKGWKAAKTSIDEAKHLKQLKKYGKAGFKELENGSIRYYGNIKAATNAGEMQGARLVREWNPISNSTRTWYETLDFNNRIRQVHPKYNNLPHYVFDINGKYTGKW